MFGNMVARARRSESGRDKAGKFFPSVFPNIGYFESNDPSTTRISSKQHFPSHWNLIRPSVTQNTTFDSNWLIVKMDYV